MRSEVLLYSDKPMVHIFFPGTFYTPGYEHENLSKPKITLKIEERDGGHTPEYCASWFLQGNPLLPVSQYTANRVSKACKADTFT